MLSLHYSDLQPVTAAGTSQNLTEFKVETFGISKSLFSISLPFSWIIYNQINSLLYHTQAKNDKGIV